MCKTYLFLFVLVVSSCSYSLTNMPLSPEDMKHLSEDEKYAIPNDGNDEIVFVTGYPDAVIYKTSKSVESHPNATQKGNRSEPCNIHEY